jgi:hypothetical protein
VAQLGARLDGIEEVVGSNPIGSTNCNSYEKSPQPKTPGRFFFTHYYHRRTILSRRIPSLYSAQIQRYANLGDLMRGFPYFAFARTYWSDICCHACQSTKDF